MVDTFNRLEGARSTFGVKKPVRAATTGNITLSGFQTIDGVTFASGDEAAGFNMRVLVKNQTASEQNGIYYVTSSAWQRAKDFDGNTDLVKGTIIEVAEGTVNAGKLYRVDSSDPPSVGVNAITFLRYSLDDFTKNATIASATTVDLDNIDGTDEDGDFVTITGTTTISNWTLSAGRTRIIHFEDSLLLTNVSSNFYPGGGNTDANTITTRPGDIMVLRSFGATKRVISYFRKDGHPLIAEEVSLASASTVTIDASGSLEIYAQCYRISGSTTINSFGSGANTPVGAIKCIRFEGALTIAGITGAGTGLPNGQSVVTQANDILFLRRDNAQTWRVVNYFRANTHPLITGDASIASAATTDLGSVREQSITITGTTAITSFGSSAPAGAVKFVDFADALTLTHNGTSLILPGSGNIRTAAGDSLVAKHEGSGNWRVALYTRAAGLVSLNTADAPNSTTSEEDLITYSLPASRLASSNHAIRIKAWGVTAATTETKRARLYFGATVIADTGSIALNDGSWMLDALVARTSSTGAQKSAGTAMFSSSPIVTVAAPAENPLSTSAIDIRITGLATSTGDMTARALSVELLAV